MKIKSFESGSEKFNRLMFYLVPVTGIVVMSARQHLTFLFMPVYTFPVPMIVADALLIITSCAWVVWFVIQVNAVRQQKMSKQHLAYLLSHYLVYVVAYILITDITVGWLAINIWHNLQYISFVWNFNSNKFKNGVDKNHFFLSWMSQPKAHRIFVYFSVCLIISYCFYSFVNFSIDNLKGFTLLPLTVIAYQTINFHHYVVDTLIWKIRKPAIRASLGINT